MRAVYAGTFDPLTNGHLWMIEQGAALCDELIVAIGDNPEKRTLFTLDERLGMLRAATAHLPGVRVAHFSQQFLVHFAAAEGARVLLRGIRNARDFAFEHDMRQINADLAPEITTLFLLPPRDLAEVSATFVKGLIGLQGWQDIVRRYVPATVYTKLIEHFARNES